MVQKVSSVLGTKVLQKIIITELMEQIINIFSEAEFQEIQQMHSPLDGKSKAII